MKTRTQNDGSNLKIYLGVCIWIFLSLIYCIVNIVLFIHLILFVCTHLYNFIYCICCSLIALNSSFILVSFTHFNKKAMGTSTYNLEEYRGEALEPFTGNPASLLVLSHRSSSSAIVFKFRIICHQISTTPIHPLYVYFQ